jgi:uncharacterized membrane protein
MHRLYGLAVLLLTILLAFALLLCALVAGFLFAFAVVIMPGIQQLDDGPYLRAFQVIDRVIQDNQPLFMLVWVGSVLAVLAASLVALIYGEGLPRGFTVAACLLYLAGVQFPTMAINIPLNNRVKSLDIDVLDEMTRQTERQAFELRWNRSNGARTMISVVATVLLIAALCFAARGL